MDISVTVEKLNEEDPDEFLPSHEILRENLKAKRKRIPKLFTEFKCQICKKVFSDKTNLKVHEKIHNPENPYQCEQCSYQGKTRKYLNRHILKVHKKHEKNQECHVCGMRFFFKCQLDKHFRVHSGEKPNKCEVCGKAFNSRYSLNTHKLIHTDEKPYKCSFCDYACRDGSSLRKHHSSHLGIAKRYPCNKCSARYDTKARLQEHFNRKHTALPTRTLSCDMCGSLYKNKYTLANHIKTVHEKSKYCTCAVCGKRISNISNLKAHLRIHIDAKPFKCSYKGCTKKYRDKTGLRRHLLWHSPVKQMFCNECGRRFTRRGRLVMHLKRREISEDGKCPNYYGKRSKKYYGTVKERDPNRVKMLCDTCGYSTTSKSKLVKHMKYGHGAMEDRECQICKKTFRRNEYLKLHYWNMHSVKYKSKIKMTTMVVIKQEPEDMPEYEGELLDIDKEELFLGFDTEIYQDDTSPADAEEELDDQNPVEGELLDNAEKSAEEMLVERSSVITEQMVDGQETDLNEPNIYNLQAVELTSLSNAEKSVEDALVDENVERENYLEMNSTETEEVPGRPTMQVSDFIQHIVLAEESEDEIEKEDSERYVQKCLKVLMQKTIEKNGFRLKKTSHSRKLKRVEGKEATDMLAKFNKLQTNNDLNRVREERETREGRTDFNKTQTNNDLNKAREDRDGRDGSTAESKGVGSEDVKIVSSKRKVRRGSKRGKSTKRSATNENSDLRDRTKSEKDSNTSQKIPDSLKLLFNSHQCYVCLKLFKTKPELIEHCKEHFDVCNEVTLKKCPLCPYVTHRNIKRHLRLVHARTIDFSFMRFKDKRDNVDGSRYYFDVQSENIDKLEIVPSIKILNKKASMDLDKRNRELKDKSVLKRKLTRKGAEWIVETEKLDLSDRVVPVLKDSTDHLASLRKLNLESKKRGVKILFPCNACEKVCQNLSALTLHMRRHDPNAKPFKPKVWKHKTKGGPPVRETGVVQTAPVGTENRMAKPKPIVNKHRCDPKLKDFYETNIKGGDIEFWQFLKIYNKMSRENVNDFRDLEARTEFGLHFNSNPENNNQKGCGAITSDLIKPTGSKTLDEVKAPSKTNKLPSQLSMKLAMKKAALDSKRRQLLKRRCEAKAKLRQKIANPEVV